MALITKNPGYYPVCFDGYDVTTANLLGGEIGRLVSVSYVYPPTSTSDKAAYDVYDGYSGTTTKVRPAVTSSLPTTSGAYRPLFLLDEGTLHYGTAFGVVIGGSVGTVVQNPTTGAGGTVIGPHTALASGKVTCWDKPGLYAVTLDAVAATVTPTTNGIAPGDALYANTSGQLTLTSSASHDNSSGSPTIVGRFVEFSTNGSLVTTPSYLAKGTAYRTFTEMLFHFRIEN